ncbi:hypothetical protein C8F01DRAFT_1127314 [Mycena amicta]|nr:hypothetical protein C8F01DRAFT_1127314 [Mycena amicta]
MSINFSYQTLTLGLAFSKLFSHNTMIFVCVVLALLNEWVILGDAFELHDDVVQDNTNCNPATCFDMVAILGDALTQPFE